MLYFPHVDHPPPPPVQFMTDKKELENVEYFNYLGGMITHDARCTCENKSRVAMDKEVQKKKSLFTNKLNLYLSKELVMCYIWIISLRCAETWTFRKVDHK